MKSLTATILLPRDDEAALAACGLTPEDVRRRMLDVATETIKNARQVAAHMEAAR